MRATSPVLIDPAVLPRRVLMLSAHPEDAVLACGGLVAFHAQRGDALRVLVLCDGSAPPADPSGEAPAARQGSRLAGAELGAADLRFVGHAGGRLGAAYDLVERLRAELEEFTPELVYAPSPDEPGPDHRAALQALAAALRRGPVRRVWLYGVGACLPGEALVDTTAWLGRKRAALARLHSGGDGVLERRAQALDSARSLALGRPGVEAAEGFVERSSESLLDHAVAVRRAQAAEVRGSAVSAVISTWNKVLDLCANLDGLRAQTRPFDAVIVVDNASGDDTVAQVSAEYPEVRLIVMPHSAYGACETFNIGFASASTPLVAILDDDVVLPPEWLEKALARLEREPQTTAILSTEVLEPGMPAGYLDSPHLMRERYMSTFRGCASLARLAALRQAGYYDERLYIYGNERDLTCRLLARGWRVLQYPALRAFHKTPFGIKLGKRSLYYHARNAWLTMLKYAPARDLARLPWLVLSRVVLRRAVHEHRGEVSDATGTIGIGRSLRETPGAWWVLARAALSVLANLPYCLRHRQPVRAPDFELPLR